MAQFFALAKRNLTDFTEADLAPYMEPEAERARELYAAGTFREIWSRADIPGAAILIEAASLGEARGFMESLPLAIEGMLTYEIMPFMPYRGFGPRK